MRAEGGIAAGAAGDGPPWERRPAHACRAEASWGDDCRFVPLHPPHSALALLAMDGGECEWRRKKMEEKVLP